VIVPSSIPKPSPRLGIFAIVRRESNERKRSKNQKSKIKNQKVNIENMKMNQLLFWATLAVKQEG